MEVSIRAERGDDRDAVWRVNRAAFPTSAEADLVDALRAGEFVQVSLVATLADQIVGHILFTRLPIKTTTGTVEALSLAPMAVIPERQRQGIGSKLVDAGLTACREQGQQIVLVLGHPEFYPRFGFSAKLAEPVSSPFGGGDAWMAAELSPAALTGVTGHVEFPPPFGGVAH